MEAQITDGAKATTGAEGELHPIGALARQAGVSTRTVRYYEEIGLLRAARRYAAGRRVFDGDALNRLRFIARLKTLGFSLQEISHLNEVFEVRRSTAEMLEELDRHLERHLATVARRQADLEVLRDDLEGYRERIRARRAERQAPRSGKKSGGGDGGGAETHRRKAGAPRLV